MKRSKNRPFSRRCEPLNIYGSVNMLGFMQDSNPAIEAAKKSTADRGEAVAAMQPLVLSEASPHRPALADLAIELAGRSAGFRRSLPDGLQIALADLVRAMNSYYSNLIEGHHTHPIDIERALEGEFSHDVGKRHLQLEAKAHIIVQRWIDGGGLAGRAVTTGGLAETHERFCALMPEELLWVEDAETGERSKVTPGEIRRRDVAVGRHICVSPGAVPRFLEHFERTYGRLGKAESILAAAAAHHRLLWIHPFLDGNGRVARLMSHAMLLEQLDTGGVWSIARGLARSEGRYKGLLAACDLPRRNDLDGRGALSEEALVAFTRFFLETCLDQVSFMERLVQPDRLRARVLLWAEEEIRLGALPSKAGAVLEAVLYRGELPRSELPAIVGSERHGRRIASILLKKGVLTAESTRAPLRLAFPATLASRWMPGLFPETPQE
jgi:Fic family protein